LSIETYREIPQRPNDRRCVADPARQCKVALRQRSQLCKASALEGEPEHAAQHFAAGFVVGFRASKSERRDRKPVATFTLLRIHPIAVAGGGQPEGEGSAFQRVRAPRVRGNEIFLLMAQRKYQNA